MAQSTAPVALPAGSPGSGLAISPGMGSTDQIAGLAYQQQFLGIEGYLSVAFTATVTLDASKASVFEIPAMSGNVTLAAPLNPSIGQIMTVVLIADSGAARTITLNGVFRGGPTTTTAASKAAIGSWVFDGTSWFCIGSQTNV